MRLNRLITVPGSNATGKSTRMTVYIHQKTEDYKELFYQDFLIGRLYTDGVCVIGNFDKRGVWESSDRILGKFASYKTAKGMWSYLVSLNSILDTVIIEGYFGLTNKSGRPCNTSQWFHNIHMICLYYDTVEEYIARTEARTGVTWESKGRDPSKTPGWKVCGSLERSMPKAREELEDSYSEGTVERMSVDAPRDAFVLEFFLKRNGEALNETDAYERHTDWWVEHFYMGDFDAAQVVEELQGMLDGQMDKVFEESRV